MHATTYGEVGRGGPDTGAFDIEYGGLVHIAAADQTKAGSVTLLDQDGGRIGCTFDPHMLTAHHGLARQIPHGHEVAYLATT